MTRTRKWVSGTVVLVLLVLVAGWFLLVSPKKADASNLQATALTQQGTNDGLRAKVAQLKAQDAAKPQQEAKLALFRQQVPENPAEAALVRKLSALSKQSGVEFESLLVVDPAGLNVPSAPAAGHDTVLEQITLSMTIQGSYYSGERFLNLLEGLKRVTLVTGLVVDATANASVGQPLDPSIHKFVITVRVFTTTDPAPVPASPTTAAPATGNASPTTVQ
jgi:Tfp pilus assembly protein PilO